MLRKGFGFRRTALADAAPTVSAPSELEQAIDASGLSLTDVPIPPAESPVIRRPRVTKKRFALALFVLLLAGGGAGYTQKATLAPRFADTSRDVIGDEKTAKLESWFFRIEDRVHKPKYSFSAAKRIPSKQPKSGSNTCPGASLAHTSM